MTHNFKARIRKISAQLKQLNESSALVISSNPAMTRSADQHYRYRANSDLYYLTGISSPDVTLVIRATKSPRAVVITPPPDPHRTLWEGALPSLTPYAKRAGIEVVRSNDTMKSLKELLRGVGTVYTQTLPGSVSCTYRGEITKRIGEPSPNIPHTVGNSESFTAEMRLIKDSSEVKSIKEAGAVTGEVLHAILPLLCHGTQEREISALIDYYYRLCGGEPAFETIVASGPSAATLHYHAGTRTVKKGDLLLIDTGIELNMYASDVTRTIPIGEISEPQAILYEAVLRAQKAAIKKVKHNAAIRDLYLAAAREITVGLKEVGILTGNTSTLVSREAFKPYFPHGIGHSLGIDVHDVGGLRGNLGAKLRKGMVFTIEPGIYVPKTTKHVPACGIRIEDDVFVTQSGCNVLTEGIFPKELHQLQEL